MHNNKKYFFGSRPEKQEVSPRIRQVYIELSTYCNLSCSSCVRQSIIDFNKSHFTPQLMRRLAPMIRAADPERIVLLGFGEALCNPHFKELLATLRETGSRIVMVSNASFLTEEMSSFLVSLPLDELYVSWDDDVYGNDMNIRRGASADVFRKNLETLAGKKAASGSGMPVIGLQIVATRSNYRFIAGSVEYGRSIGMETFIVSNLYPYSETMAGEIVYGGAPVKKIELRKMLRHEARKYPITIANQELYVNRACPFMERGTIFITAGGDIAPCPELAYTHPAFYSGIKRMHHRFILGNITDHSLEEIWNMQRFADLRKNFTYFDFPDCMHCRHPDLCQTRTLEGSDCFGNNTPCGECLWARGIILCP